MSDTVRIELDRKQAEQWLKHRHSGIEFAINDKIRAALDATQPDSSVAEQDWLTDDLSTYETQRYLPESVLEDLQNFCEEEKPHEGLPNETDEGALAAYESVIARIEALTERGER